MHDRELKESPVNVSAYIFIDRELKFHESESSQHVATIRDTIFPHLKKAPPEKLDRDYFLNGAVSIQYNARELLGIDYWTKLASLTPLHNLYHGRSDQQNFQGQGLLTMQPNGHHLMLPLNARDQKP